MKKLYVCHCTVTLQERGALCTGISRQEQAGLAHDGGPALAGQRGEGLIPVDLIAGVETFRPLLHFLQSPTRHFIPNNKHITPYPNLV